MTMTQTRMSPNMTKDLADLTWPVLFFFLIAESEPTASPFQEQEYQV